MHVSTLYPVDYSHSLNHKPRPWYLVCDTEPLSLTNKGSKMCQILMNVFLSPREVDVKHEDRCHLSHNVETQ
jgi:hypothetical protein